MRPQRPPEAVRRAAGALHRQIAKPILRAAVVIGGLLVLLATGVAAYRFFGSIPTIAAIRLPGWCRAYGRQLVIDGRSNCRFPSLAIELGGQLGNAAGFSGGLLRASRRSGGCESCCRCWAESSLIGWCWMDAEGLEAGGRHDQLGRSGGPKGSRIGCRGMAVGLPSPGSSSAGWRCVMALMR